MSVVPVGRTSAVALLLEEAKQEKRKSEEES